MTMYIYTNMSSYAYGAMSLSRNLTYPTLDHYTVLWVMQLWISFVEAKRQNESPFEIQI